MLTPRCDCRPAARGILARRTVRTKAGFGEVKTWVTQLAREVAQKRRRATNLAAKAAAAGGPMSGSVKPEGRNNYSRTFLAFAVHPWRVALQCICHIIGPLEKLEEDPPHVGTEITGSSAFEDLPFVQEKEEVKEPEWNMMPSVGTWRPSLSSFGQDAPQDVPSSRMRYIDFFLKLTMPMIHLEVGCALLEPSQRPFQRLFLNLSLFLCVRYMIPTPVVKAPEVQSVLRAASQTEHRELRVA